MKLTKKITAIFVAVMMVVSSIPFISYADSYVASITDGETTEYYESVNKAFQTSNWRSGTTLTLLADIEIPYMLVIGSGERTLDLNGYGIRSRISSSDQYKNIFYVNGADCFLTVNDSGSTEHKYTVDENGLATVDDSLEETEGVDYFTFNGGYITDAIENAFYNYGNLTINAGTLIGNRNRCKRQCQGNRANGC